MSHLHPYTFPNCLQRSSLHRVWAGGIQLEVLHTEAADIVNFALEGTIEITVERGDRMPHHAVLRPFARGKSFILNDRILTLQLDGPGKWVLEFDEDWRRPLLIFVDPIAALEPPEVSGPLRRFAAGTFHQMDCLELEPGESLWLEPGAVVEAPLLVKDSRNVVLQGPGILLGSFQTSQGVRGIMDGTRCPTLQIAASEQIEVRHLMVLDTRAWSSVCLNSTDVCFNNHKSVSWSISDDGLDIVGSERIRVMDSFIMSRDDCISLKACRYDNFLVYDGRRSVRNIEVSGSIFINLDCGNALEVGFETHCPDMTDIHFHDCDILRSLPEGNRSGAALSVHAGNEAVIRNVVFERLRIEHALDKFFDLAIFESPYTQSVGTGQIKGVIVRDIDFYGGLLPRSFILGLDPANSVEDVLVERIHMRGAPCRSILNTNHGIPTTIDPHGDLEVTEAVRLLTEIRHGNARFNNSA